MYEKDDCVLVLDGLFPAQNSDIHRQQEKTLLEITRVVGDGIEPARMRGQKVAKAPPRCGVLFTGEYCIGKGSDAARLLPIKMTIPIDNDRLQETQFCLEAAYKLYLTYRREKGFISKTECLDDYDSFYNQLRTLIVEQNDRVNQVTRTNPDINYLTIIRACSH